MVVWRTPTACSPTPGAGQTAVVDANYGELQVSWACHGVSPDSSADEVAPQCEHGVSFNFTYDLGLHASFRYETSPV